MKIGISTGSLSGHFMVEDALYYLAQNKVPVAEVFLTTYSEYKPSFGEELAKRQGNVYVSSVHAINTQFEGQLFARSPRQAADAFEIYENILKIGARLGAKYYILHGPHLYKYMKYTTDYPAFAAVYNRLQEMAFSYNMSCTWENVHWAHYNHEDFPARLEPYLTVPLHTTLDTKQAMQAGSEGFSYLAGMGGRVKNVHLCDYTLEKQLRLPGEGDFDFPGLFARLKENGYQGDCLIEVYSSNYEKPEDLLKARRYLEELAQ